ADAEVWLVCLVLVALLEGEFYAGNDQEQAEQIEDPTEMGNGGSADQDEYGPKDERDDDADQQHLLLVCARHVEARHDDHEYEQIIDRQAVFGDVPRKEFNTVAGAPDQRQAGAEQDRQRNEESSPRAGFLHRRLVRFADVGKEAPRQQRGDADHRGQPDPKWYLHSRILFGCLENGSLGPPPLRPCSKHRGRWRRESKRSIAYPKRDRSELAHAGNNAWWSAGG